MVTHRKKDTLSFIVQYNLYNDNIYTWCTFATMITNEWVSIHLE